jgi:enoyl-CoA hydratase
MAIGIQIIKFAKKMIYENILVTRDEAVQMITINREAKMNALNMALLQEIKQAVLEAESDPEIRGIIITGSGPKAFAAGADIAEFAHFGVAEGTAMSAAGHDVMNTIERCGKPVVAAVNGFALGGGCELALACHIRVASDNARFGQPEVNLGVPPGYGGTQRLVQLIGKGKALELMLTTDMIKAPEALQLGLVNYVVPPEELINICMAFLKKTFSKSPMAIAAVIECVNAYYYSDEDGLKGMKTEIAAFGRSFGTGDFIEGTSAFLEKREAKWK